MILMFDEVGWFNKILRPFFGGIDHLIYSLIAWIVEGIFELSSITVSNEFVQVIYNRVYVVLSLFMIFKISFSFIQYLISPDTMTDKEKGVGKVLMRVVVMLCMLVGVPILFFTKIEALNNKTFLQALQDGVLETLPRIILGVEERDTIQNNAHTNGQAMASKMLASFYYPAVCDSDSTIYNEEECETAESDQSIGTISDFKNTITANANGVYTYQYVWPMTTVAGVFLVVILLGIAIDIAIRVFKLLILQVMAPVPIMSYIDPKASKDGAFSHWSKSLVSTYLDIFFKIGIVYIVLMLVSEVFQTGGLFEDFSSKGFKIKTFMKVFLAIGLFKFAKDAPKFIKDALGMKDNGSGGGGFMGKAMSGLLGAGAGFLGGMATGGLAGGLSGIMAGAASGAAGKPGEAFKQVRDEQAKLLGKTPGGMKGKLQNKAMQRSVMKHTGLDKSTLKKAKEDMIEKQNAANKLLYQYQKDPTSVSYDDVTAAQAAAAKAQSHYNDANSLAGQIGLKSGFMKENKRHGAAYVAVKRVQRAASANIVKPASKWVDDQIKDVKKTVYAYEDKFLDGAIHKGVLREEQRFTNADDLSDSRVIMRGDKRDYKKSLKGGIGNTLDSDELQKTVAADRKTYKQEKKDGRI